MKRNALPHLLYVAWGYPPARSGGVYRALATANLFARNGWRVTVLTVEAETFEYSTGTDQTLLGQIDPDITVVRTPFDVPSFQRNLRSWSRWRARYPEWWNVIRARRDRNSFPESVYGSWRKQLESAAISIHESDPVDMVVATANPNVDFTAGLALNERFGTPYVMDYRDAWQLSVFSGRRVTRPGSAEARLERTLIRQAHEVWFVNEPIRSWHETCYPDQEHKFHVVANGYDQDFASFRTTVKASEEALTFGYIGTISNMVPMRELLEGWQLARSRSAVIANSTMQLHGYLDHSGMPDNRLLMLIADFAEQGVSYLGPVVKSKVAETYESFDALLLVLGAGKYVTSGKVFEYAATGLPIISIHDPANAASAVLAESPVWVPTAGMTPAAIADALVEGARRALAQTSESRADAQSWATQFERSRQLSPRIRALAEAVSRGAYRSGNVKGNHMMRVVFVDPSGSLLGNVHASLAALHDELPSTGSMQVTFITCKVVPMVNRPAGRNEIDVVAIGGNHKHRFRHALSAALDRSSLGRSLLRVTPWDNGSVVARAMMRSQQAKRELGGADVIVAMERDAILSVWKAARRRPAESVRAGYGLAGGIAHIKALAQEQSAVRARR